MISIFNQLLIEDKRFYVYIYLDPRKPNKYEYIINDNLCVLDYEPFYVGKGCGKRLKMHITEHSLKTSTNKYKIYQIQDYTIEIIQELKKLSPNNIVLNDDFQKIINSGTNKKFNIRRNDNWLKHTQPMLDAFYHAKYFLEMIIKYGNTLNKSPECLPSGWALVLCLYNMR